MLTIEQSMTMAVATQAAVEVRAGNYTPGCARCDSHRASSVVYADAHRDSARASGMDWSDIPTPTREMLQLAEMAAWRSPRKAGCRNCPNPI